MSKSPRKLDYLSHIAQAIEEIETYTAGLSFEQFEQDKKTQRAVVLCFIIMGEASTKLLTDHRAFTEQYPDIEWQAMRGMRNQLAHGYFAINLTIVWNTIVLALPTLKQRLAQLPETP